MKTNKTISSKTKLNIQVEDIPLATELLPLMESQQLATKFADKVHNLSSLPPELVEMGKHAFLAGMHRAYADHRPFTISPEMIWLLIQQGIALYLYHNVGAITKFYPELIEKKTLVVRHEKEGFSNEDWQKIIASFTTEMKDYLEEEFVEKFTINFSGSTPDEITASNLMLMDAMQPYFEYIVSYCICGIPSISLEGQASDWQKILDKIRYFKKLDLSWWLDQLEPIIEKIKNAANGEVDQDFWRNMFKVHTKEVYGRPKVIDGWITRFYPFDKKGERILEKELVELSIESIFKSLPSEIRSIPFKFQLVDQNNKQLKEIPMEFWTGFIGLSQDTETLNLRPEIGWMISPLTDKEPPSLPYQGYGPQSREYFSLSTFPTELLEGQEFKEIILNYKNEINYPENITSLKVRWLELNGSVTDELIKDLKAKFQNSEIEISVNDEHIDMAH